MNNIDVRTQYFGIYEKMYKEEYIKNDLIETGNLALFIDYFFTRTNWKLLKFKLEKFINNREKQNLYVVLLNGLYTIAKTKDIGDNIEYNFKKLTELYKKKKLNQFDLIYDAYDFPVWFNQTIKDADIGSREEVLGKLLIEAEVNPHILKQLLKPNNLFTVKYLIDRGFQGEKWFYIIGNLMESVKMQDFNETAWMIWQMAYPIYLKELKLSQDKQKQKLVTIAENNYRTSSSLFQKKQLTFCDIIPEEVQPKLNICI